MNILIVSRGVRPISTNLSGGAESVLINHTRSLALAGHDVQVVSDFDSFAPEDDQYVIHPVGVPKWFLNTCRKAGFGLWIVLHLVGNTLAALSALRVIRSSKQPFDVIHCHGNLSGLLISLFHKSTPIVYTEHDSTPWTCYYPSPIERQIRKIIYTLLNVRLYKRDVTIAVLYGEQKAELELRWAIGPEKVVVVANGVNEQLFTPVEDGLESGPGFPILPVEEFCLFVGRLEPRKGVEVLLRAIRQSAMSAVIVGDGPERSRLEALSTEIGVDSRVTFMGGVLNGNLMQYYRRSAFFVVPSYSEAFPLTALEAMACGKPIVATRVGGIPSLVEHNDCGLLCETGDIDDLTEKIELLAQSPQLAQELGDNARRAVLRDFTWEIIACKLEDLYGKLAAVDSDDVYMVAAD